MRYSKCKLYVKKKEKENYKTLYYTLFNYIYRVRRENFDTAHRKVDGIEMNIKVSYRLAIFAIIIEILIF